MWATKVSCPKSKSSAFVRFFDVRRSALIKMYESLSEKICTAPASSHIDRHRCEPGGYIDHIIRVTNTAIKEFLSEYGLG